MDLENKWGDYTRVFSLMGSLQKRGHKIFVFIIRPNPKKPRITYLKENGIDVIEIHPPLFCMSGKKGISRHLNYIACMPAIEKEASKIIKENGIDIIYSYMPGTGSSLPAMKICSKHKIPFILDLADMYSLIRPKMILNKSFKKADKIIVITDYLKSNLLNKGISSKKIHLIPNGVDLDLFNSNYDSEAILKLKNSFNTQKLIVFCGSLQDLTLIINSAKIVLEKYSKVKYVIVGDHRDPNRSRIFWEKQVKEKGLEKNFEFLGKKPKSEIPQYIHAADVCIDSFPNEPYYAAAHPIKLLEYGACGKAIVATDVSETSKLVVHGKYGFLADSLNETDYANYIIKLLNDPILANKMGKTFQEHIRNNFNWNFISEKFENCLT